MTAAKKTEDKKVELQAIHRIKGLKAKGAYIEPKEKFTTDPETAESLVKRGGAVLIEKEEVGQDQEKQ